MFGVLAVVSLGYKGAGSGGETNAPAHSDSAAGQALLTKYFPRSTANPTNVILSRLIPHCTECRCLYLSVSKADGPPPELAFFFR